MLGNHFTAQLAIGKLVVTDNVDLLDLRLRTFGNFEHYIDAVLVELHHFWFDSRRKTALTFIQFDDTRDIGANLGARENLPRRKFDFWFYLVILQAFVAFENDPVNHRVFADLDNHRARIVADADVGKQFGCIQVFQRLVGADLRPCLTRTKLDVGADSVGLQTLRPDDGDRLDLLTLRNSNGRHQHGWRRNRAFLSQHWRCHQQRAGRSQSG